LKGVAHVIGCSTLPLPLPLPYLYLLYLYLCLCLCPISTSSTSTSALSRPPLYSTSSLLYPTSSLSLLYLRLSNLSLHLHVGLDIPLRHSTGCKGILLQAAAQQAVPLLRRALRRRCGVLMVDVLSRWCVEGGVLMVDGVGRWCTACGGREWY